MNLKLLIIFCSFWTISDHQEVLFQPGNDLFVNDTLRVFIYEENLIKGEEKLIDVYSPNFSDIVGFQVPLSLDHADFIEIVAGEVPLTNSNYFWVDDQEQLRISWNTSSTQGLDISDDAILFSIRLRANRDVNTSELFKIDESHMSSEAIRESFQTAPIRLEFEVLKRSANALSIQVEESHLFPNVFTTGAIEFSIRGYRAQEAILYSFGGERLGNMTVENNNVSGNITEPGIYIVKVFDGTAYHNELITVN